MSHTFTPSLAGKVVVITGASSGLGEATARHLAARGAKLVLAARRTDKLQSLATELSAAGAEVLTQATDVTHMEQVQALADATLKRFGRIDVLVNNAGITRDRMFLKMTPEDWRAVIETNLNSMFNVTKQVVADMVDKGWGRIVNISSINGAKGQAGQTNYSAAKAGMHGFSKALAQELASKGVTVNTVSPGYVGTDMVRAIREDVLEKIVSTIPVKRLGEPKEIASMVAWLASDEGGYATGAEFSVNGGQHMQ